MSAITTDAAGNVYVTGGTMSATFPVTSGVVQPALNPGQCPFVFDPHSPPILQNCRDAFVMKFDASGNVLFATYFGGSGADLGQDIAVDDAGNIYVAGATFHPAGAANDFPTTPGAASSVQSTLQHDAFVLKLNSTGTSVIYSTLIPNAGDGPTTLALDSAGNVYFAGNGLPANGTFPPTPGAFQTTASNGAAHGVVAKLNAAGSAFIYATWLASSNNDGNYDIAVDAAGNAYISGTTSGSDFPITAGAFDTTLNKALNTAFAVKLNATGSALLYATYLPQTIVPSPVGADTGLAIRTDAQGNAIVVTAAGKLFKLNSTGTAALYQTALPGRPAALALDASGNAYVASTVTGATPVTTGATQRCFAGGQSDMYVAQVNASGTVTASTFLGGSNQDYAVAIATSTNGSVTLVAGTNSVDFPGTSPKVNNNFSYVLSNLKIADPTQPDLPCIALTVQNGATFVEGAIAPGELVTLRGVGMGPDSGVQSSGPFPTSLGGVSVLFDGVPAPLLYVQSAQINVQAPFEISGRGSTAIQVQYQGASSNKAFPLVTTAAPGIFLRDFVTTEGAILNGDGTINSKANPAKRGSLVSLYATGGGLTNPASVTGALTPLTALNFLQLQTTAKIGSADAQVQYSGAAPTLSSGVIQVNIFVPTQALSGTQTVSLTIGGVFGTAFVTIEIQ